MNKKISKKHIESIEEDSDIVTIKFHKNPKDYEEDEENKSDSEIITEQPTMENESDIKQKDILTKEGKESRLSTSDEESGLVHKEMEKSPKCIDTHSIIRVLGSYPFDSSYWNYLEPEQPLYEALRTP